MTSDENRPRGLGFGAGILAGLLFSAAAVLTLSLTTPLPSPPTAPPAPDAAAPAPAPTSMDGDAGMSSAIAPAPTDQAADPAPPSPSIATEMPGDAGLAPREGEPPSTDPATETAAQPPTSTATEIISGNTSPPQPPTENAPAGERQADAATVQEAAEAEPPATQEATETPTTDTTTESAARTQTPSTQAPDAKVAEDSAVTATRDERAPATSTEAAPATPGDEASIALDEETSEGPPDEPIWRVNAAPSTISGEKPLMSVVVVNARSGSLPALKTLAPLGGVSVAIAADEQDSVRMVAALRALGHEALAVEDGGAEIPPGTVGLALATVPDDTSPDAVLARAEDLGALIVDLAGGAASRLVEAGREAAQPVGAATLRIAAGSAASDAFQVLRNASALAVRDGSLIVAMEASPTTLTALGRWLALPGEVEPAPLSALIERLGPTRY